MHSLKTIESFQMCSCQPNPHLLGWNGASLAREHASEGAGAWSCVVSAVTYNNPVLLQGPVNKAALHKHLQRVSKGSTDVHTGHNRAITAVLSQEDCGYPACCRVWRFRKGLRMSPKPGLGGLSLLGMQGLEVF